MKQTLTVLLALALIVGVALPASAMTFITADGTVYEIDEIEPAEPQRPVLPEKPRSSADYSGGTGSRCNLDIEVFRLAPADLYVGGSYGHSFTVWDAPGAEITYRFDEANSAGRIELDQSTGNFTITRAGDFIIEIWVNGEYYLDSLYQNVASQAVDLGALRALYGQQLQSVMASHRLDEAGRLSYAQEAVRRTNEQRVLHGLPALEVDVILMDAAMLRSEELAALYSHTRPNGERAVTWARGLVGARAGAENIARGYGSGEKAVAGWMNSTGHRENLLNEKYTRIGIGCYDAPDGTLYWVQLFAS